MSEIDTEEYEQEVRSALVCEDNDAFRSDIIAALEGLKYNVRSAAGVEDTFDKLRFNEYGLIVLNEKFGGNTPETGALCNSLQMMPMSTRRKTFLVMTGKEFRTADNMTALSRSVNLVVNEKDIADLKSIMRKAIADNELFYKTFRASLAKSGKQ